MIRRQRQTSAYVPGARRARRCKAVALWDAPLTGTGTSRHRRICTATEPRAVRCLGRCASPSLSHICLSKGHLPSASTAACGPSCTAAHARALRRGLALMGLHVRVCPDLGAGAAWRAPQLMRPPAHSTRLAAAGSVHRPGRAPHAAYLGGRRVHARGEMWTAPLPVVLGHAPPQAVCDDPAPCPHRRIF